MPEAKTLAVGTQLDAKYQILRLLGEGGAGQVYLATHLWTKREVAIKVLSEKANEDQEVASRFLREARATAKLRHPNVVDILDMGKDPNHGVYLVMESLQGETLEARLDRAKKFTLTETLELLVPVMDGLRTAHNQGIVHRDLKPANMFIAATEKGTALPKILDFGIAKILADAKMTSIKTETGTVMGTPYYMSPEQIDGRSDIIDHRTDIWSMGVVLYECITGERPFEGPYLSSLLAAITSVDYVRLADRPEGQADPRVAEAVDKCLQFDPADRLQSMEKLIRLLRESPTGKHSTITSVAPGATRQPAVSLAPPTHQVRLPSSSSAKRARMFALVAIVLLAITLLVVLLMPDKPEAPPPQADASAKIEAVHAAPKPPPTAAALPGAVAAPVQEQVQPAGTLTASGTVNAATPKAEPDAGTAPAKRPTKGRATRGKKKPVDPAYQFD